jgi:Flp pilus assembly protein TadB
VPVDIPPLPPEVSTRQQEVRALVDAGAASPEELRALAEKLKEQRTYEETLWQRDVRPALMQAKKKRPSLVDLRRDGVEGTHSSVGLGLGLLAGALVVFLIATQTSFLLLLVAAAGVLVYAWIHGLRPGHDAERPAPPPPTDGPH